MKKAFLQLHIAIFLAGFTGILGRLITLNEGLLVWYRMLFTIIALWLIVFISGNRESILKTELVKMYLVGGIVALHWVFFYGSIKYANVSIGLVCFSAVGFFTALLEPLILKRRINAVELLLGLMVMVGIYFIFHFDPKYKTGIILGIISSLLATCFTIFNKIMLKKHSAMQVTVHELTGGWLSLSLLLPVYLYFFPVQQFLPSWSDTGWLLVLSLFCTVLAFNLSMNALRKISPFTVNLSYNLEPLYGILLAFIIYREDRELQKGFYIGISIILVTVVLQSLRIWKMKS
jgi:drug/metabolite transporter (DMT)-like permease